MKFEWDDAKDAANRAKHGIGLGEAAGLNWANGEHRHDRRFDYGEERQEVLARLEGRLHNCVYTMRNGVFRIISLRKANMREARRYDQFRG
jgi:uncharacterized protein